MPRKKPQQKPQDAGEQSPPETKTDTGAGESAAKNLFGKTDQIGTILTKGLDLAEAGFSLGLHLINRMGSMAQSEVLDRIAGPLESAFASQQSAPEPPAAPEPVAEEAPAAFVSNRLQAFPGHPFKITFSINNDSVVAPKKVRLSLEGFSGERTGTPLKAAIARVQPGTRTIGPMDFEKFTISGTLPEALPPDVYTGWVVVQSETSIRIPVRLMVSGDI